MKVLVADDDPVSRLMLQAAVEGLGHECTTAVDGGEAWKLIADDPPDVLVTDRMMPGLDGLELCKRVRADSARGYTYVILVTSLTDRDDVLGGMEAGADDYLTKPLDPFDVETRLVAAKRVTALHVELTGYRSELDRLASTDPLTGLPNRRALEEALYTLHVRSQRYGRHYCLAMCDVDFFKAYNDALGHPAGDQVLWAVGAALLAQLRDGDGAYRYGGEEFLLLLPEQTSEFGQIPAERVRRAVEDLAMPHPASPEGIVTLSVGLAAFAPGDEKTEADLLEEADAALYSAKQAGRNRVHSS